jgi:hypothetical protein
MKPLTKELLLRTDEAIFQVIENLEAPLGKNSLLAFEFPVN